MKTLLVIGAGPKALALHVKARALRIAGREAPNVVIVEQHQVGAHWLGQHGYTDGQGEVITPPEKDLGFPYRSIFGTEVDRLVAEFSWQAFQIAQGRFSDWVDRLRPRISHYGLWEYLNWVAKESQADIRLGTIKGPISCDRSEWTIPYYPIGQITPTEIRADSLVITGPGRPRTLPGQQPDHPTILNSVSLWIPPVLADIRTLPNGRIAVVGSGDTAASAVVTLLDNLPNPDAVHIDLFCGAGVAYSRANSYGETKYFTDPREWTLLPERTRQELIRRTDRGVFSDSLKKRIDDARNVHERHGYVYHAEMRGHHIRLTLNVGDFRRRPYRLEPFPDLFNRLVVATGFRRYSFEDWFDDKRQFPVKRRGPGYDIAKEIALARLIQPDLSFRNDRGWPRPKLFLPMLASLACGPGFSNLGCLGEMSDRIIKSHIQGS